MYKIILYFTRVNVARQDETINEIPKLWRERVRERAAAAAVAVFQLKEGNAERSKIFLRQSPAPANNALNNGGGERMPVFRIKAIKLF